MKKEKKQKERRRVKKKIHSSNAIVLVTGDMKPSARINEGWIPALKGVIRIWQASPQCVESVSFWIPTNQIDGDG